MHSFEKYKILKRIGENGIIITTDESKESILYQKIIDDLHRDGFLVGKMTLQSGDIYSGVITHKGEQWLQSFE